MKDLRQKDYNAVLLETNDFFKAQGISIIGEGYKEIATNPALLESYIGQLTEGTGANSSVEIAQLMANTNAGILRESAVAGIAPIASLSMPVIRKLWPKFALKEAFETEVAKTPRFVVSYMRPYMSKGDGDRVYLPHGLRDLNGGLSAAGRKTYIDKTFTVAAAATTAAGNIDFTSDLTLSTTTSAAKKQFLDSEFRLVSVQLLDISGDDPVVAATAYLNRRIDVSGGIVADVEVGTVTGQAVVRVDLVKGNALVAWIGEDEVPEDHSVVISLRAAVGTEFNEDAYSVGFDVARLDIDIPTGQHINAPLPIETLNDLMALYNIDGTKETVDLMTNVFANKLDLEALEFLVDSFEGQPGVAEFAGYPGADAYELVFDVRPAAGFAGAPKEWREELKPQIDFLAQKIKNQTYLQAGTFNLIGNPLDIQIIQNIDWKFRGGQGAGVDGVDVDYSVGTYVGAHAYKVISSVNVPAGGIYIVFLPSAGTQMTYKYYPYTFSTEQGYIDPNRSRVPSIMMTKRHTFAEFLPAIGKIEIVNNTGTGQFNSGYWPIEANSVWGEE
jgi:hypothetical protein